MKSVRKPFGALLSILICSTLISCDDNNYIEYPDTGEYGENLLDIERDTLYSGDYSLNAILEEEAFLDVKFRGISWAYETNSMNGNWEASPYEITDNSRVLSSLRTGEIDAKIRLTGNASLFLDVFENGDTIPTWSRSFEVLKEE